MSEDQGGEPIWFISDTHFSHGNIIKYSNRPFLNPTEQSIRRDAESPTATGEDWDRWQNLRLCRDTVRVHDDTLVENWNKLVGKQDRVFHLGDFCFGDANTARAFLERLNGRIFYVQGNHDKPAYAVRDLFQVFKEMYQLKISDPDSPRGRRDIILCHYAMRVWNKSHHGAFHLYGHSHGSLADDNEALSMDVGVDATAMRLSEGVLLRDCYRPISYYEVRQFMSQKSFTPIDHHGR